MNEAFFSILTISAPLLFATLGALCSEYAGVLAVFMDGTITLAGFLCIMATAVTGSPLLGFLFSAGCTVLLLFAVSVFTEKTRANPFITGLSINLFAAGITSWLSVMLYGTRGVISLTEISGRSASFVTPFFSSSAMPAAALAAAVLLFFIVRYTSFGLNLRISGAAPDVLTIRGISPSRCRTASWCIAGFFAACAGAALTLRLGAFVPNISSGRGWTALAAVYLGYRNPLLCIPAVLIFASAEYITTVLQGTGNIPATLILGLPYALALLVFILAPAEKAEKQERP
ncbi:ABC transporter permease [Brucepastera parasyntrophica]|uniref:ABC transporter permease n=1 Tax=Brucepastera parasyntrophica TaxID=2880008 RepID=UPI00210A1748|nr:ABC transporter permease [Brucepastera parasyntrophica]ULQ59078.1 ABC transporter permease [Brucepastera parasyntrophica]